MKAARDALEVPPPKPACGLHGEALPCIICLGQNGIAEPGTFDHLLEVAVKRGVIEFEAGPFKVKFGPGVHAEWQRVNRPIVER